jgi:general secretion pathway protein A
MYLEQFGLAQKPFEQTPDSRFLYASEQHAEALAAIKLAIAIRDPFVIITGEIGSGKTTLLNRALGELEADVVAARVTHTRLSDIELLQMILVEFGIEPFGKGKVELVTLLRGFIEAQAAAGRHVAIAVDEAQNLTAPVLEELRLLTCIETEQLRQRCRLRFHIDELTSEEVAAYVRHRMSVAGGEYEQAFAPGVDEIIYRLSHGLPRLINLLCDTALIACVVEGQGQVSAALLEDVVRELNWDERAPRAGGAEGDPAEATSESPRLEVTHRGQSIGGFSLGQSRNVIGRGGDCDVVIDSKFLSRHHAVISREAGAWMLRDLHSTNGTRVNGRRVECWQLADGDEIGLGKHRLVFVCPQPERRSSRRSRFLAGRG